MADVKFHYLKSTEFRTIHVDGIFGGLAPTGFLNVACFNERLAIAQAQTFEVKADGTLGQELRDARVSRDGITREVEVNLVMSMKAAQMLHEWLGKQLTPVPPSSDQVQPTDVGGRGDA